jgi:FKBP-type peptidyl-prolyl cis-trans isomerase
MSLKNQIAKRAFMLPLVTAAALLIWSGCKNGSGGYKKTASKLEYKIIDDEPGTPAKAGDFLQIQIITRVHDTSIFDTHKMGGPLWKQLVKPNGQHYDLMEGFALLSKGDSAEFVIPADSVMNPFNRPSFVKKGDMIHIYVKVLDVKDSLQYESSLAQEKAAQQQKDEKLITAYLDSTHQTGVRTDDGVYVVTKEKGSGAQPQDGQEVTIMYTGKTLDGKVFDSNEDSAFHHTQPLPFVLGQHRMIPGMEAGVKEMRKGGMATLIIPSAEAYGHQGRMPAIKPDAVLIFDVKLVDISGKPNPSTPQGGQ